MSPNRWNSWLGWVAALLLLLVGCGKSDEADAKKPFTLAGASKVLDALQKKDYEGTVTALAEVKATVTEKDKPEYRRLRDQVTHELVEVMGDSEPAKEAYRAIGMMETGR